MEQNQISALGATRVNVGLSAVIKITPASYLFSQSIKILAGAGTLEIVNTPATLGPGAGATGWGAGYPVGSSEIVNVAGGAVAYLVASGATVTVGVMNGFTNGITVI